MTLSSSPALQGYTMPAEWAKHRATWLSWPCNPITWEGHLAGAEQAFVQMIEVIGSGEQVELCVPNAATEERARRLIGAAGVSLTPVRFHTIETGDVWFRDYGPVFVAGPQGIGWTKWGYNAYGGKYDDLLIGNDVPWHMPIQSMPHWDAGIILEGGSIDVNGTGTLLTTESCLLSEDRNPTLRQQDIEDRLKQFLGVQKILWLTAGIAGDDTTGHVDDLTRFVARDAVVTIMEEDPQDENYPILLANRQRLAGMSIETGERLRIIDLPMPRPREVEGRRMAESYANFLVANAAVLVPTYGDPADPRALATLRECFTDRPVVGIDCRELIWGYGSIHCASMQEPSSASVVP